MTMLTAATTYRRISPRAERAGVSFTIVASPVGLVLVANETGSPALLAVLVGDDEHSLHTELAERFPRAPLTRDDGDITAALAAKVVSAIDAPARVHDLALDPRGTDFQRRVWRALREIPAGETTTYAELAQRIGAPSAVRAVASACAANPIAIVVPCHRVVRSDGSLSGYRWGVDRKRELLRREGALD